MRSDALIKHDGMKALNEKLGLVEMERFIALINRERFDYTLWQENLFEDMTLEELCYAADKHWQEEEARGR